MAQTDPPPPPLPRFLLFFFSSSLPEDLLSVRAFDGTQGGADDTSLQAAVLPAVSELLSHQLHHVIPIVCRTRPRLDELPLQ
eukprot:COSAG06_NODE_4158_length_4512_cov_4.141400_5_plen_82_part_00